MYCSTTINSYLARSVPVFKSGSQQKNVNISNKGLKLQLLFRLNLLYISTGGRNSIVPLTASQRRDRNTCNQPSFGIYSISCVTQVFPLRFLQGRGLEVEGEGVQILEQYPAFHLDFPVDRHSRRGKGVIVGSCSRPISYLVYEKTCMRRRGMRYRAVCPSACS